MNKKRDQVIRQHLYDAFSQHPVSRLGEREKAQLLNLLAIYYRHIEVADLEESSPVDLLGALIAHWQLLGNRRGGDPVVRVYNPNFEEHGWRSTHTIIEVVADDMAFLVDSISMALNRAGLSIYLTVHPVVKTVRSEKGELIELHDHLDREGHPESMIRFQVEKQLSVDVLRALEATVTSVMEDVICANADWDGMIDRIRAIRNAMPASMEAEDLQEHRAFLTWLENHHFTFLAYCEYDLVDAAAGGGKQLELNPASALGLFRRPRDVDHSAESVIPVLGTQYAKFPCYLVTTKSNAKSTVHRPAYMDFIGIKRYDEAGEVSGIHCFVGLFASTAYSSPPHDIPLLRKKMDEVIERIELPPFSHYGKVLLNILNTFPRDLLFQMNGEDLLEMCQDILRLQERQRTRLFVYRDSFERFYTCLIYLPRENYSQDLRIRMQKVLVEAFRGTEVEFSTMFSESILARVQFIIHTPPGAEVQGDLDELERRIIECTHSWQDRFKEALVEQYGESLAAEYYRKYAHAFPGGYREDFYPRTAAADIARLERSRQSQRLGLHFYRPILETGERVHCRLYSPDAPIPLSEVIPILENMGLSVFGERPYHIRHAAGSTWIHDFSMGYDMGEEHLTDEASELFQDVFLRVWEGSMDSDGFNQLVLAAGLNWQQIVLLRAYSRYLKQIKFPYSQSYVTETLARHAGIVSRLVKLFDLKFNPDGSHLASRLEQAATEIETALESVLSLDHDQILRGFVNLIQATLRTNYFQLDESGRSKSYLSLKIDPRIVAGMPLPKPMFEVFVFSTRMEGVHLRGGKVARGGLRWSDRMEDFRTEVLGLMKAQTVKNTVIVPVGSKGGFIVKRPPPEEERERLTDEVIACYKTLLRGMLDITDNLAGGKVVTPPRVVRYDEDDPYLVIAADKGTASFSDIANGVAAEYGFWLGDAFASGGSAGYDHKKMGITAKGAWESVKRNFRELGIDIQTTDFRVIGIGDMSGDVFGNGMLLSRHIKLIGAFNHRDIFLDPDPDPERSFRERERLFRLPRSSWHDYDGRLISRGGGVYSRKAKSIVLSDEVKGMLGVKEDHMTPNTLIHHLLKAPAELLWNGGIGTYVKARSESHEEVKDKTNDALRINGQELRCKVVGEGGNLGFTQLGRIEYAEKGGQIYTDSIDNSAGVDCSDHEVNIKILLDQVVAGGDLTSKQRNALLAEMTEDVSNKVLADNYAQTQAISMVASTAADHLYEHARFIDYLEREGTLNRRLECLPSRKQVAERQAAKTGLTKPEIAILLAYSKMTYYQALIGSGIPDDDFLITELYDYFPEALAERFSAVMPQHRLRREIIATHLTNGIVNHIGPGIGFRVRETVGSNIAGVTRAYIAASKIFEADRLWDEIERLDNQVAAGVQIEMMRMIAGMLEKTLTWMLRTRREKLVVRDLVEYFRPGVAEMISHMPKPLAAKDRLDLNKRIRYFVNAGVPRETAQRVAGMEPLSVALDIVDVAKTQGMDITLVASVYFALGTTLEFHWVRDQINGLRVHNHWHNLAKIRLTDALNTSQRDITSQILACARQEKGAKGMIGRWLDANRFPVDRQLQIIAELKARASVDFPMLSVAVAGAGSLISGNH